jgi:hypothetical protein
MLNKKVLKYIDYSFGDKIDKNYMYGGIYNKNILLIKEQILYTRNYCILIPNFQNVPTINELNYIINLAYKNSLALINLAIKGIKIDEFLNVDNIYYTRTPIAVRYIMYIKRIPLG